MKTMNSILLALTIAVTAGGCAGPEIVYQEPVTATPPAGEVAVSQALTILDASGSQEAYFSEGKAIFESLVSVMPAGDYQAGGLYFGGRNNESTGLSTFDRASLGRFANQATYLTGTTPIFDVLENDVADVIGSGSGRAAIVLISDGRATDYGGFNGAGDRTIEAARALAVGRSGETCFHMVRSGDSAEGEATLRQIAGVTDCGSFRNASTLTTAAALQQFSRDVYLSESSPPRATPVAVVMEADSDGDGVVDSMDECPNTPKGARVDSRGCWSLHGLQFAVNGAAIEIDSNSRFREDLAVLKANPSLRIRVDGHTDSDGSAAYNEGLSTRRAASVRDYLVNTEGLEADRFEIKGFGETKPVAPNDSAANKRRNRRVELTIIE